MRLATTALLLGTFALTACGGTVQGTGGSPGGGTKSGFDDGTGTACTAAGCDTKASPPSDSTPTDGTAGATSAPSPYDSLFTTPASYTITNTSLDGVWAGSMNVSVDDVRLVITPSAITIAVRCNSGHAAGAKTAIGLTVNAVTSST